MVGIFKPYMPEGITDEIQKILYSGNLAFGRYGHEFEKSIASFIGNNNTLTISSYNQSLLIVLSTLGLKPGDEIIASPVSCLASNQPFAVKGLKVIWSDVETSTGAMDIEDVKRKITKNTKAIFHNHYCGYLGYIAEINEIGKEYGIPVVDDCIESFGSEFKNQKAGNLGSDITVFSFQTVRLPNTIDGGAIGFKDENLYKKAKLIRDYGIDRAIFRNELNEIDKDCDIKLEGYGGLMSEVNSVIGLKQMDKISCLLEKQRNNAKRWNEVLSQNKTIKPLELTPNTLPNYWVYGVLANKKNDTIKKFRKAGYYATGVHINNNIYSIFRNGDNNKELKGVKDFMDHFIALPSGWWIKDQEINF
jgi:dTDP-4-amino-4,6-dideoxygalactose transaminase